MKIDKLINDTLLSMEKQGYSDSTIAESREDFHRILALHRHHEKNYLDSAVLDEFMATQTTLFNCKAFAKNRYLRKTRSIDRLKAFNETGEWLYVTHRRKSRYVLNDYYDAIVDELKKQYYPSASTAENTINTARKHFSWLIENNFPDLSLVAVDVIKKFLVYCTEHLNGRSVGTLKGTLKRIYRYLHELGYTGETFEGILSFPVSVKHKIRPAIPQDEVALTLDAIDRNTTKGKRDYAIILIGTVLGLRGCDVSKLQLGDFDWSKGELRVRQSKTKKAVYLPLTKDVGEAVHDYIFNGRPKVAEKTLFLRIQPPHTALGTSAADCTLGVYRSTLGLSRKSFHSLRRSVGKNMVTSGVSIVDVAQVLGHKKISSTNPYVSLDSVHLKECALDFTGITPTGGACFE